MEVNAKLRHLRMSPRKVRLVADVIRGMTTEEAEYQLMYLSKAASRPILKLLRSAIANAENNFKLDKNNLYIKQITVDQGPTLKRWRARAFGRAAEIRKRSSHVVIVLDEIKATKASASASSKQKKGKSQDGPVVDYQDIKQEAKGKKTEEPALGEEQPQQKKADKGFSGLKDKFSRRLGER